MSVVVTVELSPIEMISAPGPNRTYVGRERLLGS